MTKRALVSAFALFLASTSASAITQTVTSTADGGAGTLRNAITYANTLGGWQVINFAISGANKTICPATPLPTVTTTTLIDGSSQSGYANYPLIELSGACLTANPPTGNGLYITAGPSWVKALAINNWPEYGIRIDGSGGTIVAGSFIGTNKAGTAAAPNKLGGIVIDDSDANQIGGTSIEGFAGINLISGNGTPTTDPDPKIGPGLMMLNGASGNKVWHNWIGVDVNGTNALPNQADGIQISQSDHNIVGDKVASKRNVISGNGQYGILISADNINEPGVTGLYNLVTGNFIGTDKNGVYAVPNVRSGILIYNAGWNTIGGSVPGEGNVIAGNTRKGITIDGSPCVGLIPPAPDGTGCVPVAPWAGQGYASHNVVFGNYIGINVNGTALPNGLAGIHIWWAQLNGIGGDQTGQGNVISRNAVDGILIQGHTNDSNPNYVAKQNWVWGNLIQANSRHGIYITNGQQNYIGIGGSGTPGNAIWSNANYGLRVCGLNYNTNLQANNSYVYPNGSGSYTFSSSCP